MCVKVTKKELWSEQALLNSLLLLGAPETDTEYAILKNQYHILNSLLQISDLMPEPESKKFGFPFFCTRKWQWSFLLKILVKLEIMIDESNLQLMIGLGTSKSSSCSAIPYRIIHSRVLLVLVSPLHVHLAQGTLKSTNTETTPNNSNLDSTNRSKLF